MHTLHSWLLGATAALCAFLLTTSFAVAQPGAGTQSDSVGFGTLKRTFNMTDLAGSRPETIPDEDIRGVVEIGGLLYVAGTNGGPLDDHKVYVVNPETTTLLGSFSLPEPHQSSVVGAIGLDADCLGNIIAAGAEGIAVFDTSGNQVSQIFIDCGTRGAADGAQSIPLPVDEEGNPVVEAEGGAQYCGVALDEEGDGGTGSLWISECDPVEDAPPSIKEIRIADGTVLKNFPSQGFTPHALVLDPITGNFWTNSGNPREIIELDYNSLTPTGFSMAQIPAQEGMQLSFGFGGMTLMPGGDPTSQWDSAFDLVSVSQQFRLDGSRKDDFIGFHRLHQFPDIPGYAEVFLAGSTNSNPLQPVSPILFGPNDVLNWRVDPNGRPAVGPAVTFFNFGPGAFEDGVTDMGVLGNPGVAFPELVALSPFSTPPSTFFALVSTGVGSLNSIPLAPTGFPSVTGQLVRLQSVYFDPGILPLNLGATNELVYHSLIINDVTFEMDAPSSFQVNLVDPFIRLTEHSGLGAPSSIVKLIIDLRGSATLDNNYVFDVTQGSMFDIFAAGNGLMERCSGTYRNGSHEATGLIFANGLIAPQINTPYNLGRSGVFGLPGAFHPVCFRERWPDPMATEFPYQSGFIASVEGNPPTADLRLPTRLEFNFMPGVFLNTTFEFDVDIDGGPDSGGDLAGTYVEVHLNNGTVHTGNTLPDGANPDRSVIGW